MSDPLPRRTRLGGVGAIATAAALTGVAGVPGAITAVAVVLTWVLVADIVTFAVAAIAVGALLAADAFVVLDPGLADGVPSVDRITELTGSGMVELLSLVVLGVALIPLLLGSTSGTDRPIIVAVLTLLLTAGLATLAVTPILAGETVLVGAAVLAVIVAVFTYSLHRYGLLVSGVLQHG